WKTCKTGTQPASCVIIGDNETLTLTVVPTDLRRGETRWYRCVATYIDETEEFYTNFALPSKAWRARYAQVQRSPEQDMAFYRQLGVALPGDDDGNVETEESLYQVVDDSHLGPDRDAAIAERLPTPIKSRYPRCRHMVHEQLPTAIDEGPFRMITSIQLPPSLTDGRLITLQLHALTGEALCHRTICIQGRYFQPYRSF
ncbi:hypothetical protein BaRGS_00016941, partial [Batillaria attramentaria]